MTITVDVSSWRRARSHWMDRYGRLRLRLSQRRHQVVSSVLLGSGMAGALGGGALIDAHHGMLGLVLLAESAAAAWVGWMRDDADEPIPDEPGVVERSIDQILEVERRRP